MILAVLLASLLQPASCIPIESDRIYGRDLGRALPLFQALPPDLQVAFSPVPGQQRVFSPAELGKVARANNLKFEATQSVCFAWPMSALSSEAIVSAISATLEGRHPHIEIVEQSRASVPKGQLVFPLAGLSGVSGAPVVWRGYVIYARNHRFSTWARVRITVKEPRVVALETLNPGKAIRPEQVQLAEYEGPFTPEENFQNVTQVSGTIPRNIIPVGAPVTKNAVQAARDVERGDLVHVVAQAGAAVVESEGIAEQGGARGEVITVRNAKTKRTFRARIEEKGKVLVIPGASPGIVAEEAKS